MGYGFIDYLKFVIQCMCAFFDAVVGNPGLTPEAGQKLVVACIAVAMYTLSSMGVMYLVRRTKEWKNAIEILVSSIVGLIVALITFFIAYLII